MVRVVIQQEWWEIGLLVLAALGGVGAGVAAGVAVYQSKSASKQVAAAQAQVAAANTQATAATNQVAAAVQALKEAAEERRRLLREEAYQRLTELRFALRRLDRADSEQTLAAEQLAEAQEASRGRKEAYDRQLLRGTGVGAQKAERQMREADLTLARARARDDAAEANLAAAQESVELARARAVAGSVVAAFGDSDASALRATSGRDVVPSSMAGITPNDELPVSELTKTIEDLMGRLLEAS